MLTEHQKKELLENLDALVDLWVGELMSDEPPELQSEFSVEDVAPEFLTWASGFTSPPPHQLERVCAANEED